MTRKFLDRAKEDKPYQFSSTTLSCARHLAEFFYLVENEKLISPFVSKKLKEYMLRFDRQMYRPKYKSLWLEGAYINYYTKGGWLETNLWKNGFKSAIKSIFKKQWAVIRWSNDVGVVTGRNSKYVIVYDVTISNIGFLVGKKSFSYKVTFIMKF